MRNALRLFLLTASLVLLAAWPCRAQQSIGQIAELREQIAKLEGVERDTTVSSDVKELNHNFLTERRFSLRSALRLRIQALERYKADVGASLTAGEGEAVEKTIRGLQAESDALAEQLLTRRPVAERSDAVPPTDVTGGTVTSDALTAAGAERPRSVAVFEAAASGAGADDTNPPISPTQASKLNKLSLPANVTIDEKKGTMDKASAENLIKALMSDSQFPNAIKADDYFAIHVVQWKNEVKEDKATGKKVPTGGFGAGKDTWYLYHQGKWSKEQFEGNRIFGKNRVAVISVYYGRFVDKSGTALDAWEDVFKNWSNEFELGVKPRIPTPFVHLLDLLGAIAAAAPRPAVGYAWSAALFTGVATPSTLTLNENVDVVDLEQEADTKTFTHTYEDEGRYLFDFSVGMPVNGVKELQYSASDNIVRTREVKRENAYGFLNVFFRPVDVSSAGIFREPHLVFGVPISGKPLDRPIVGLGMGIDKKNFLMFDAYVGVVFNRERVPRTLGVGESATENQLQSDLRSRRVRKLAIGINLPVSQFLDAIKKK